ncbi:MAG: HAD family hydrolase [Pseudomonadota bacterium]
MTGLPVAISFDLDGTLYSTRRVALRVLWATRGRWRFLRIYRTVRQALRPRVFEDGDALHTAEVELLARALVRDVETTRELLHRVHEVELVGALGRCGPDALARPLILALHARGVRLAVLSDLPVVAKLEALGLADLPWTTVMDAGDTGALKPHARPFERVAQALGVSVEQLVHVGDRHDTDVTGAESCGASAVWLTRKADEPVARTTWTVRDLAELADRWELALSPG